MAKALLIKAEIGRLCANYRHPLTPDEYDIVAATWVALFRDMADGDFVAAVQRHLAASPYFPNPAQINEACQAILSERPKPPTALDTGTGSREERRRCAINAAMMRRSLAGDMRARDFMLLGDNWLLKEPLAHEVLGDQHPDIREKREAAA